MGDRGKSIISAFLISAAFIALIAVYKYVLDTKRVYNYALNINKKYINCYNNETENILDSYINDIINKRKKINNIKDLKKYKIEKSKLDIKYEDDINNFCIKE